ncbi:unnamed protein product [Clonostachys rosea]|uniref:Uncharacterized protein n=1 Tax=Bionectria ochroleuca TaxID=29856 RepID=A0ABY6UKW8_BIOOC|nr:unnamed protein product [Clonostachys rosea]
MENSDIEEEGSTMRCRLQRRWAHEYALRLPGYNKLPCPTTNGGATLITPPSTPLPQRPYQYPAPGHDESRPRRHGPDALSQSLLEMCIQIRYNQTASVWGDTDRETENDQIYRDVVVINDLMIAHGIVKFENWDESAEVEELSARKARDAAFMKDFCRNFPLPKDRPSKLPDTNDPKVSRMTEEQRISISLAHYYYGQKRKAAEDPLDAERPKKK